MQEVILKKKNDPLGMLLLDYLKGRESVSLEVRSTTLEMSKMTAREMFRTYSQMDELEHVALDNCKGHVLDVGAGSGCHSLILQEKGVLVDGIDISPGCVEVMLKRGVANVFHESLFHHDSVRYDTLLMLMNGIGICGSLEGLNLFFQYLPTILSKGGQVLADSTDVSSIMGQLEVDEEKYPGETEFQMKYKEFTSLPFEWLYIDFSMLEHLAKYHGFRCEQLYYNEDKQFLTRLTLK